MFTSQPMTSAWSPPRLAGALSQRQRWCALVFSICIWTGAQAAETVPSVVTSAGNAVQQTDDPARFVEFTHEDDSNCQMRDGKKIFVHSTHPSRRIRVWLDRYYQNVGTGDRGRSDLAPAAEAEPLGCDTVMNGQQEWRVARALYLD